MLPPVPAPAIDEKPIAVNVELAGGGDFTLYFATPESAIAYCTQCCQRGFISRNLLDDRSTKYGLIFYPMAAVRLMGLFDRHDEAKVAPFPKHTFQSPPTAGR